MRRKLAVSIAALAVLIGGSFALRPAYAQIPSPNQIASPFSCSADDVGATLTKFCAASPDNKLSMYVTGVVAQSTTSTAGNFILRYGTGSNCGTGTTSLLPSAATAARLGAPANTSAPAVIMLPTPLKVPAGNDLCVLGIATQTFTGQVVGYFSQP